MFFMLLGEGLAFRLLPAEIPKTPFFEAFCAEPRAPAVWCSLAAALIALANLRVGKMCFQLLRFNSCRFLAFVPLARSLTFVVFIIRV